MTSRHGNTPSGLVREFFAIKQINIQIYDSILCSPADDILNNEIKITANCSRHVLFTAARRGRKDGRRKAFGLICGHRVLPLPLSAS